MYRLLWTYRLSRLLTVTGASASILKPDDNDLIHKKQTTHFPASPTSDKRNDTPNSECFDTFYTHMIVHIVDAAAAWIYSWWSGQMPPYSSRVPSNQDHHEYKGEVICVLLGETGSGKSSLVDLFHYWSLESTGMQPKFEKAKEHSILNTLNEAGGSQAGSQTIKPHPYEFDLIFERQKYRLLLLDTPGMGDVQGLKKDDDNMMEILKLIENTPTITAVVLILNGSNARVTPRTQYILQRVYGMCPQTFENNLYLIFTNTQIQPNFEMSSIKVPIRKDNVIPIDNLLYSPAGLKYAELSGLLQRKIQVNYEDNKKMLSYIFDQLLRGEALRPEPYRLLRQNRDCLRLKVRSILKAITDSNKCKADIDKEESTLMTNIKPTVDMLRKKATMTTESVYVTQHETPYHNTSCLTCANICHEQCSLDYTTATGQKIFEHCACMKGNVCTDKKCGHQSDTHVHVKFIYRREVVKKPLLTDDETKQLEHSINAEEQKKIIIKSLNKRRLDIETQIHTFKDDLHNALKELKDICPHYDYIMEIKCAIKLLEEEELLDKNSENSAHLKVLKEHFNRLMNEFEEAHNASCSKDNIFPDYM